MTQNSAYTHIHTSKEEKNKGYNLHKFKTYYESSVIKVM